VNRPATPRKPAIGVNPAKTSSHFIGSGFTDKEEPQFFPGKRLDPTTNLSHLSIGDDGPEPFRNAIQPGRARSNHSHFDSNITF
jgi:hypothetical protein